jgi:hypothetical protein
MRTPEIMLTELNANLRRLRGACSVLDNEEIYEKLLGVMRRLLLAEVLSNTWILAVGGSQGAGKTSLMSYLYKCQNWLPSNEGRGEKMPVLVVENKQRTEPQGYIRRLQKNETSGVFEVKDVEVDVTTFNRAICDPNAEELLPVLQVPSRYFKRDNQAWLLLPGYEKQDRANKSWQELMRQAMISAGGCIVVTDQVRMANQQQLEIVRDMLSNELRHCKPYIVISRTEKYRHDFEQQAELRKSAQATFQIEPECADKNIILTGVDDDEYMNQCQPKLQRAIDELNFNGQSNRVSQVSLLSEILRQDLTPVLSTIRSKSRLLFSQDDDGTDSIDEVLETFDDAAEQLRNQHNDLITRLAGNAYNKAVKELDKRLISEHEGFKNWLGSAFETVSETKTKMQRHVQDAWVTATPAFFSDYSKALASITLGQLGQLEDSAESSMKKLPVDKAIKLIEMGYVHTSGRPVRFKALNSDAVNDIKIFLGRNEEQRNDSQQTSRQLAKSVRLIPSIALEYSRLFYAIPEAINLKANSNQDAPDNLVEDGVESLQRGAELGQTAIKSIAGVLAVDVLSDGDSDILGTIFGQTSSDGPGVPIPPPIVMHPIAIAVTAAVAATYITVKAVSGLRTIEKKASAHAHDMLANIHDFHVDHLRKQFDKTMKVTRERIKDVMRERYKLDESLMRKDRLTKAVADATSIMNDLKHELDSSTGGLQLFITESRV